MLKYGRYGRPALADQVAPAIVRRLNLLCYVVAKRARYSRIERQPDWPHESYSEKKTHEFE